MMLIVWLVVGVGALLLLGILGYGLYGQLRRLRGSLLEAQADLAPRTAILSEGIRRAQSLRMNDAVDTTRGHRAHA